MKKVKERGDSSKKRTEQFILDISGRVLHKNLPPGASRSIIEMSALKKGNDLVAVKMLHG